MNAFASLVFLSAGSIIASALRLPQSQRVEPALDYAHQTVKPALDVVMPMHNFNCVVKASIEHINTHISPRRILVVTRLSQCAELKEVAANVKCLDQDKLLPGVTKASIAQKIDNLQRGEKGFYGNKTTDGWGGHDSAGWYLQQFIKLGIGESPLLRGSDALSETYMVLDSDVVPLSNLATLDQLGRMPLMMGGPAHGDAVQFSEQDNQGKMCDYEASYKQLTGMELLNARTGQGFVPHHMMLRQEYVKEMLAAIATSETKWHDMVIDASCGNGRDANQCSCGFSEYASMASWMKSKHRDDVYDVQPKFIRSPPSHSTCCLTESMEQKALRTGMKFITLEQGLCNDLQSTA